MDDMTYGGYDYRRNERLWQRVAPILEPYPGYQPMPALADLPGQSAPAAPPASVPEAQLPGAEQNPCCMGTEAAEMLEVLDGFIEEEPVDIPEYQVYKPAQQEAPGNVRTVKGADHERLLENPIYRRLYESYNDAVQQINLVRGDMRTRCEGYERRIRGYRENIQTLQREVERLKEALHAGA